ncbi:MAG: chloride channel protein [Acidimicrobiia bacterium]|nr:chloride channel protein [Acidimicrobiia bacterium]MDH4364066.1 chloride channel protein [Acidimicrobiia bacterium]MDH5288455.1 chloride channel protein [Acidimicrobiia bacterium]
MEALQRDDAAIARAPRLAGGRRRRAAVPARLHGPATLLLVAAVAVAAAGFARGFRWLIGLGVATWAGSSDPLEAASSLPRWRLAAAVAVAVFAATAIGRRAMARYHQRLGMASVAAAARGEGPGPSLAGSLTRAAGTLAASAGLTSIGRESAIIETGGSLGASAARLTGRPVAPLASAGIAAAFSAAYHAPLAAVLYTREHLGAGRAGGVGQPSSRSTALPGATAYAAGGAVAGFAATRFLFGSGTIFPAGHHPLSGQTVALSLVALIPAYAASRIFFLVREQLAARTARAGDAPEAWLRWIGPLALAVAAGTAVATAPGTAGNGMEAIEQAATGATVALALTLMAGKLVATTFAIGAGAPGGIVSPSMAVAAGAALTTFHAVAELGVTLPGSWWDGALVAMAVGLAASVRSPLVAIVMVAEMTGDLRLVPLSALIVGACYLLDSGVARLQAVPLPLLAGNASRIVLDDDA